MKRLRKSLEKKVNKKVLDNTFLSESSTILKTSLLKEGKNILLSDSGGVAVVVFVVVPISALEKKTSELCLDQAVSFYACFDQNKQLG